MGVLPRCALFLLLASAPVLAGPGSESRWGLRWSAPPGCIQAGPLARAVEARLGRTVFGPEPEFLVDGVLERGRPSGWKARLSLVDARGNVLGGREVSTAEEACSAIDPRLLLVIALMIDPSAALSGPAPELPPSPAPPELPAAEQPPPEPTGKRGERELTVAVSGTLGLGFAVAPGLAGTLWSGGPGDWTWLLRFALYPYAPYTKDGGHLTLVSPVAEAGVCPVSAESGDWRVSACGSAAFALVFAHSEGFQQSRSEALLRGDVGPRFRLERRLDGRRALHTGLGVSWGWLRPTVRLIKPDGTAEDPRLGLPVQVTLDVGVSFPGPWEG
ncbi:hypothetical protein [Cystobacter ferrugineus]|uniref:Uncharacterized protein n=1 Tax=Cystobacter ferrugineus TaxID=83449 RepID=A0A1L9BB71_9BACT|nr:hypothetical protein [Cystobacter ferrugineus]OJH39489.1 hypothetical protein BON30_18510 [Cystobacter ferrugineus]